MRQARSKSSRRTFELLKAAAGGWKPAGGGVGCGGAAAVAGRRAERGAVAL